MEYNVKLNHCALHGCFDGSYTLGVCQSYLAISIN